MSLKASLPFDLRVVNFISFYTYLHFARINQVKAENMSLGNNCRLGSG